MLGSVHILVVTHLLLESAHILVATHLLLESAHIHGRSLRCRLLTSYFLRECDVIFEVIRILLSTLHQTGKVLDVCDVTLGFL